MNIRTKIKELWRSACLFDGLDPESGFVVFSEKNPFLPEYYKWLGMFLAGKKMVREMNQD